VPKKPLAASYTEQGNKDIDKELFPGDIKVNSVILDAEVDILQHIDDLLNDLMKNSAKKPLADSYTELGNKDINRELLSGDIMDKSVILDAEEHILQETDGLLHDLMKDSAKKTLAVSCTEQGKKDIDKKLLSGDIKVNSVILDTKVDILRGIDAFLYYLY
jgi:hypothetical protein